MDNQGYYEQLRAKLQAWAATSDGRKSKWLEYVLLLPDFAYLISSLLLDPDVPAKEKAKLGMVMAYIITPFDLLPEGVLGPAGYADDVALAAYVLNQLLNHIDDKIVLRHWKGEGDLLKLVRHIVEVADRMVGGGLWSKLKGKLGGD